MTFQVHSAWLERHFDGTDALDFDATGAEGFTMGIVTESVIDPDSNSLYSGLTAVGTATAWTGPEALTSLACGLNGSNNLLWDSADPSQIAQDGSGFTNGRSVVIIEPVSGYVIESHIEASAFGNQAGPVNISWPSGLWLMSI